MVSGKKSIPSRGSGVAQTVTRTTVSPRATVIEPLACVASLPVSMMSELAADLYFINIGHLFLTFPSPCDGRRPWLRFRTAGYDAVNAVRD